MAKGKGNGSRKVITSVSIEPWQAELIEKYNINLSALVRDFLTAYFTGGVGDPSEVELARIKAALEETKKEAENTIAELEGRLKALIKEIERVEATLEERAAAAGEPTTPPKPGELSQTKRERIKEAILAEFPDGERTIEDLKKRTDDIKKAVRLKLFTIIPRRLNGVSLGDVTKVILADEDLAFLRTYLED